MNWDLAMNEIGARFDAMSGMRRFEEGEPPEIPCAVVSFPENIDPHGTYNRGVARMTMQAMLLTGVAFERQARQFAATYVNDSAAGVVSWLEGGVDAGAYTAFDELTVTLITFAVVNLQEVDYMAVLIDLDVAGQGV